MIYVHLAEGFEEIEALTAVDVLRRASIDVQTVSVTGNRVVTGTHGVPVTADILYEDAEYEDCEMIVLPGGMPGTTNLKEHAGVRKVVKEHTQAGKYVGAICAAPTVLADLGLLKGKKITCYPTVEQEIQGAVLLRTPVAVDGNIVTGRGAGTAVEFALKLIEVLEGEEKAQEVAKAIVCQ